MSSYKFEYENNRGKRLIFWIATIVAAVLIISAFIAVAIKLDKLETTKTLSTSSYAVGVLDDTTGKHDAYSEDESGIYTKEFITVDGLVCKLVEDAEISYQINWYASNKSFISVSSHTEDFNALTDAVPEGAAYCKIEIFPNSDDDGIVSRTELRKYAEMLTVTFAKK